MQIKHKTVFCLLIITLFTSFFFARSVVVRERWIVPTFLSWSSPHQAGTGLTLSYINHWLKEGAFNLRFAAYMYPASVEMPSLDTRGFYGSIPPGALLPIYFLFKAVDFIGLAPNIHDKRGLQLLLIIFYNYLLHFLLALVLCGLVFFVCRKLGFDRLNSTLFALVPAIVQFHNSNSIYWHHLTFFHRHAIMLPFVSYVLLELIHTSQPPSRVLRVVKLLQLLVMFYGVLTDWLFFLVIMTIYIIRIMRKDIVLPNNLQRGFLWLKQSFLFFLPAFAAITLWVYHMVYYVHEIAKSNFSETSISGTSFTLSDKIMNRMGIANGIDQYAHYLQTSLFTNLSSGYGFSAVAIIYVALYTAIRSRKFVRNDDKATNLATTAYVMLLIPCLMHFCIFAQDNSDHELSSIVVSPALSVGFAFLPIFILQIIRKNYLLSAVWLAGNIRLTLAALLAVVSSSIYGYTHIYNKQPITKMFSRPAYQHAFVGNFVRANTSYPDVVFSSDYYLNAVWNLVRTHFPDKVIHFARNLDHIYDKTKSITQSFNIKIFYLDSSREEIEKLVAFLNAQNLFVADIQEDGVGGLLSFDGQEFIAWYERSKQATNKPMQHECYMHPQRCAAEG